MAKGKIGRRRKWKLLLSTGQPRTYVCYDFIVPVLAWQWPRLKRQMVRLDRWLAAIKSLICIGVAAEAVGVERSARHENSPISTNKTWPWRCLLKSITYAQGFPNYFYNVLFPLQKIFLKKFRCYGGL